MKHLKLNPFISAALIALLIALPAQAKTTLKLATVTPDHHAYTKGAQEFARLVEEATNAEVVIKVYGGGRLGKGERELLEGMQLGTIDLAVTATGPVSNFSEDMGVVKAKERNHKCCRRKSHGASSDADRAGTTKQIVR